MADIDHELDATSQGLLVTTVRIVQSLNEQFEEFAIDCKNANGHGGCLINTADGCRILGCPLGKE